MKNKNFLLWVAAFVLIFVRYLSTRPIYHSGDRVRITTSVLSDPIEYPTSQFIKIAGLKTYLPLIPEISYGDNIIVEGVVSANKLDKPKLIKILEKKSFLSNFRNSIISFYQSTLPEPMSGLLAGITLGSKGAILKDFYNQTKITGVSHVVVASGTNITFVTSFLMGVLSAILPRRKAIPFVIFGIISYLFVAGFDAPLIRAAIMSSFIFLGQETGRLTNTWRIYFLTGMGMLIWNPDWLIDIGFILSFVSTASLMLFEKKLRFKLTKVPSPFKEGLSTSLAAQIGVAPVLFVTFGQFNIWSVVVNTLVLWTIPPLMILGVFGGIVGLMFPALGQLILWLGYPLLFWFVTVVKLFTAY